MSRTEEATKELEIALTQTFAALVTDGVIDPKELRRRASESVVLGGVGQTAWAHQVDSPLAQGYKMRLPLRRGLKRDHSDRPNATGMCP
jgi:hypothetical protein